MDHPSVSAARSHLPKPLSQLRRQLPFQGSHEGEAYRAIRATPPVIS